MALAERLRRPEPRRLAGYQSSVGSARFPRLGSVTSRVVTPTASLPGRVDGCGRRAAREHEPEEDGPGATAHAVSYRSSAGLARLLRGWRVF